MSDSKHTPGPWRLCQGALLTVEADGHLGPIADLRSRLDYSGMDPRTAETREANGHLIKAAPELLDALRRIVNPAPGVERLPPWVYGIAEPAIAKAEGRS